MPGLCRRRCRRHLGADRADVLRRLARAPRARSVAPSKPLLRKDFIVSRYQILEAAVAGADAMLLIVGALSGEDLSRRLADAGDAGRRGLVEVHDEVELQRALDAGATLIGVNSRNLRTLGVEPRAPRTPRAAAAVGRHGGRRERPEGCGQPPAAGGGRLQRVSRRRAPHRAARSGRALRALRGRP